MHFNFSNGNSASCLLYPNSNSGTELEFKLLSHLSSEWRRCLGNSLEVRHQMACSDHCLCPSLLFVSHFCFKHPPTPHLHLLLVFYTISMHPFPLFSASVFCASCCSPAIFFLSSYVTFSLFARLSMSKNTTQDRTNTNKQGKIKVQELKYIQTFQPMHSKATFTQSRVYSKTNIFPHSVFKNNIVHTPA